MIEQSEHTVTKILSQNEILKRNDAPELFDGKSVFSPVNQEYDLSTYLKTEKYKQSRFGSKYIFVK